MRTNDRINAKEVRLIGSDGSQLGIVPIAEALRISQEDGLDLVEVARQASPPVCRVIDYGKYRYQQDKREREARKKQKTVELKEIRMRISIDKHDFQVKQKHAEKFLEKGDKVKVSVSFRGREMGRKESGRQVIERFIEGLSDISRVEQPIRFEGRFMSAVLMPK